MDTPSVQTPQQPVTILLSITGLECESFSLTEYGMNNEKEISFDDYSFHYVFEIGINIEKEIVDFYLSLDFHEGKVEDRKERLATMRTRTSFRIVNFKEVAKPNDSGQILIPSRLIELGNAFSINHTRAMFALKV
ncbi:MAG TPA: hypothetical protein VK559_13610, partial [Ferruginibacter sp.]|nr:hypothetical protein [Ferruginibacter sp.]